MDKPLEVEQSAQEHLVEEIRRLVANAVSRGELLRVGERALQLYEKYPLSGISADILADRIAAVALVAGVTAELCRPLAGGANDGSSSEIS